MPTILDSLIVEIGPKFVGSGELRRLERGVDRVKRRLDGFASGFTKGGAAITAALTVTGKTFFDFEVAMNQTQATLLATEEQMEALRKQAKDLGATTQFSASQVAEAQNAMAQAGLDTNEILESTPAVLALAAAGALSMQEAAKLTSNQLRAFGLDVSEAGRVTDVLALAAARSNTSVSELGPAFRQVAPIAAAAGLTIEETAGYLGVLRNNGFAAEQAGTAMRAVLARLADAGGPAAETLKEVGLDPEKIQQSLEAGKLEEVLATLRTTNLDLNQAMKIFGTEAAAAALVMIDNGDQAANLATQFENAAGSAQQMADIQNQGVVGAVRNLKSAFEGLQIELGEAGVGGAIEWVATKLTELTLWLKDSDEWVRKLLAGTLIAGPGMIALGVAAKAISLALTGFIPLLKLARWAMFALNAVMRANPIGLLITALAALVIYWDEVTAAIEWATEAFLDLLREWGVPVDDIFAWVSNAWDEMIGFITEPISGIWGWLTETIPDPFQWIMDYWNSLSFPSPTIVWDWLTETISSPFQWIMDYWTALLGFLVAPAAGIWGWLTADEDPFAPVASAWQNLVDVITAPLAGIDVLTPIREAWQAVIDWLASFSLFESGQAMIQTLVDGVINVKDALIQSVKDALGPIGKWLPESDADEGPLSKLTAAGRAIPQTIAEGIRQAPEDIRNALAAGALALPAAAIAAPLPVGPVPPPAIGGGGTTLNVTLGENSIVIHAEGSDAGQIAAGIGDALGEEMRALVEQMDSRYRA